jgi:hypothetical protein
LVHFADTGRPQKDHVTRVVDEPEGLLSGWLGSRYPGVNILSHDSGHLWETLLGWGGDPHLNPLHLLSIVLIGIH